MHGVCRFFDKTTVSSLLTKLHKLEYVVSNLNFSCNVPFCILPLQMIHSTFRPHEQYNFPQQPLI